MEKEFINFRFSIEWIKDRIYFLENSYYEEHNEDLIEDSFKKQKIHNLKLIYNKLKKENISKISLLDLEDEYEYIRGY